MTNTSLLEKYIGDSGYKKSFIAKKIGITAYALAMKINNETEFKASEIDGIAKLLDIDVHTKEKIFFAHE
jgi:hypothetical protein